MREHIKYFSFSIIIPPLILSFFSVLIIRSIDLSTSTTYFKKQIVWILIGVISFIFFSFYNYKKLIEKSYFIYFFFILTLIYVLAFGEKISGARSWIGLGNFGIQPSEIGKLVIPLLAGKFFLNKLSRVLDTKDLLKYYLLLGVPSLLIMLQPDMGTILTYFPFFLFPILLFKVNKKLIVGGIIFVIVIGGFSWKFFLKDYQKKRIKVILNPESDPLSYGYHTIQSKIAIGSGGLKGKGYMKGTQKSLGFLPAKHTDFILSVVGEEFGFVGIITVFVIYIFLFYVIYTVSIQSDWTGMIVSFLVLLQISFQFIINSAVSVGLFPVAGVTAPFLSYGGSSMITLFSMLGVVENIQIERYKRF